VNKEDKKLLTGVLFAFAALICEIALVGILWNSQLLPGKFIFLIAFVLALFAAGGALVALKAKKFWVCGNVLLALLAVISIVLSVFVQMGVQALRDDVFVKLPKDEDLMCVLVDKDDPAKTLADIQNYTTGIVEDADSAETEAFLQVLREQHGFAGEIKYYTMQDEMFTALMEGTEIQAVILNPVYLAPLSEMMEVELHKELRDVFYLPIDQLPMETEPPTEAPTEPPVDPGEPFAVYITGVDGYKTELSNRNSDVNIIVVINPKEKQIMLLNTPRDYYIQLPINGKLQPDKLTHAGAFGVNKSIGALETLYDIDISYYFKVNFVGFRNIIDALGGVRVWSDYSFTFKETGHKIVKGWNDLDGAGALAFARERKQVPGGDEGRGKHQMKIITAVIEKAMSPALLMNYTEVLESVKGSFGTDMSYDLLANLVRYTLDTGMDWEIISHNVSGTNTKKWLYSLRNTSYAVNDCMLPNEKQVAEASKMMQDMLAGKRITKPNK